MSTFRFNGIKGSPQDSNGNEGAPDSEGSAESGTVSGGDLVGASGCPSTSAPASISLSGTGADLELAFNDPADLKMSHNAELRPLVGSRGTYKGWVSRRLSELERQQTAGTLSPEFFQQQKNSIEGSILNIEKVDVSIAAVYDAHGVDVEDGDRVADANASYEFVIDAQTRLASLVSLVQAKPASAQVARDNETLVKAVLGAKGGIARIALECPKFQSDSKDKMHYKEWVAQYEAVVAASYGVDNKSKLLHLLSKVEGSGKAYLTSLEVTDENYQVALDILKKHYEDKDYVRDELFKLILNEQPGFDIEYQ